MMKNQKDGLSGFLTGVVKMSEDVKQSIIWGSVIVLVVLSISASLCIYHTVTWVVLVKSGYEQKYMAGQTMPLWVKIERAEQE